MRSYPGIIGSVLGVGWGISAFMAEPSPVMMSGVAISGAFAGYVSRRWTTDLLSFPPAVTLGFVYGLSLEHDDTSHNLWPFEIVFLLATTAPVFAVLGWLGMRVGHQRDAAQRNELASSWLSRWVVPGALTGAVFVWGMAGAIKIELQIRSGDEGQFRTTALKIREAQIRYVPQHGVFTNKGSELSLEGVTWSPPDRRFRSGRPSPAVTPSDSRGSLTALPAIAY
ncbi:MAG: hypothetical protein QOJ99_72 [Bryobacterales bacterium]|jgi:hypothetical protein|nr:hypothetical protein [Bryobacterales bacterium]